MKKMSRGRRRRSIRGGEVVRCGEEAMVLELCCLWLWFVTMVCDYGLWLWLQKKKKKKKKKKKQSCY